MNLSIIIAAISSLFLKLKGRDNLYKMIFQSIGLFLMLYLCYFIYQKWTYPMSMVYKTHITTLSPDKTSIRKVRIHKNLALFNDFYSSVQGSRITDYLDICQIPHNSYNRDDFFNQVDERTKDSIFQDTSCVSDVLRITQLFYNSRREYEHTACPQDSGVRDYYHVVFDTICFKTLEDGYWNPRCYKNEYQYIKHVGGINNARFILNDSKRYNVAECIIATKIKEDRVSISDVNNPLVSRWASSCDLSKIAVSIDPDLGEGFRLECLSVDLGASSSVSQIIPTPDEQDLYHIEYRDSAKLAYIQHNGLSFTANSMRGERLQENRINMLIMIATLIFSLWIGLLYRITKKLFYSARNITEIILLVCDLLVPFVLCMYIGYVEGHYNAGTIIISWGVFMLLVYFFAEYRANPPKGNFKFLLRCKCQSRILLTAIQKFFPHIILLMFAYVIARYLTLIILVS